MPELDVFQAIAHPSRRELLDALRTGELPVRALAERFESSRPATSQHLRLLLDARLVDERRVGRENLYRLTPEPLMQIESWIGNYEHFWNTKLRALRTVLDETE